MKSKRTDWNVTKENYEVFEAEGSHSLPGTFSKAHHDTLSSRRILTTSSKGVNSSSSVARKLEFSRHARGLNAAFLKFFKEQIAQDPAAVLIDAAQDAIDYMNQLDDRYMRSYGEVLTFGSGDCGQLAHGVEEENDLSVRFPRIVLSLRDKHVVSIACGGLHNAVVTMEGQVYTWGCSDDGSLGRVGDENTPLLVEGALAGQSVVRVACGDGQTVTVTSEGLVYGWGSYKDKEAKTFFNLEPGQPTKTVKRKQETPLLIQGVSGVIDVCCGSSFTLALCADGAVYSWGIGECGELGRPLAPMKVGPDDDATYDLDAIFKDYITPGRMYTSSPIHRNGKMVRSDLPVSHVKAIGCGSYHCLVIVGGEDGGLFSCGLNNYGQLGTGNTDNQEQLVRSLIDRELCDGQHVISAHGGMHHSLALTSDGKMYGFGRGDSGQLGLSKFAEDGGGAAGACSMEPLHIPVANSSGGSSEVFVKAIACGGNHNLALSSSNEVYSWGFGDMLALGHGKEKDEPVPRKLNFSKIGNITVVQVAGGGQHSAIIGKVETF